jgi:hypothetical protein
MPIDYVALAKHLGLTVDLRSYPRLLDQLFPPENPYSPCMWRLAIIRDDIDWELNNQIVATKRAATTNDFAALWEFGYFLRRLSISVLEAKHVFDRDITRMLKMQARRHTERLRLYEGGSEPYEQTQARGGDAQANSQ